MDRGPAHASDLRSLQRLVVARFARLVLDPPSDAPAEAGDQARLYLKRIRDRLGRPTTGDVYWEGHVRALDEQIGRALEARVSLEPGG